jgi:hypothetical protein
MIVKERIYVLHCHANAADFLRIYGEEGYIIQTRTLGNMLGYFTTEIGVQGQIVHLWGYDSLQDRQERRARLLAEPQWLACLAKVKPMLKSMENRILIPRRFSPIGGEQDA